MADNINPLTNEPSRTDTTDWEYSEAIYESCEVVDRNVRLAIKLHQARKERYYEVARKVIEQINQIREHVNRLERKIDRDDYHYQLTLAKHVIVFLNKNAPYVSGSSSMGSPQPRDEIKSISPGGLPGLGKRR